MKNVEKREKICYSKEVTKNGFVDIGRKMVMASVIASDITDEKKLSKLKEFVKQKGEKAVIVESTYRYVECTDLKTAISVSEFIRNLKYGGRV